MEQEAVHVKLKLRHRKTYMAILRRAISKCRRVGVDRLYAYCRPDEAWALKLWFGNNYDHIIKSLVDTGYCSRGAYYFAVSRRTAEQFEKGEHYDRRKNLSPFR